MYIWNVQSLGVDINTRRYPVFDYVDGQGVQFVHNG